MQVYILTHKVNKRVLVISAEVYGLKADDLTSLTQAGWEWEFTCCYQPSNLHGKDVLVQELIRQGITSSTSS